MAWTAPRTWVTGELVTAALMNTHVKDNLDYLKTAADKHDDCTQSDVTASRAYNTVYQNTSGKIMFVSVSAFGSISAGSGGSGSGGFTGAADPPTVAMDTFDYYNGAISSRNIFHTSLFFVPVNYYYKYYGFTTIANWIEWTLF